MEPAHKDPILGVTEAFLADPSPNKVNVGVVSSFTFVLENSSETVLFVSISEDFRLNSQVLSSSGRLHVKSEEILTKRKLYFLCFFRFNFFSAKERD